MWHRQDWNVLRPLVDIEHDVRVIRSPWGAVIASDSRACFSQLELEDLRTAGVYCAGTTNASVVSKTELYDVLVDSTCSRSCRPSLIARRLCGFI